MVTAMRQNSRWAMIPTRYTVCFDIAPCTWTCGNPPELTLVQDIEHTKIERVLNLSVPRRSIATKTAFPPQALNDVQKKTSIHVVKLDLVATLAPCLT